MNTASIELVAVLTSMVSECLCCYYLVEQEASEALHDGRWDAESG